MIEACFVLFLICLVLYAFYALTKKTCFALNLSAGSVWSLLLYREFVMIFLPILLLMFYGSEPFTDYIFNIKDDKIFSISLIVIYAIFVFSLTIFVLSKYLPVLISKEDKAKSIDDPRVKKFANASLACGFAILLFSYIFLSYEHAFLRALLSGDGLIKIRLANSYASKLPSQVSYFIVFASQIAAIFSSIHLINKKYFRFLMYFSCALFLASARGDKAPVLMCIILAILSYFYIKGLVVSLGKILFRVFFSLLLLYFSIYFVASLQIPNLSIDVFNVYLLGRLGVGQMGGVFETFSISKIKGDYFWHTIPFAQFFVNYIPYDKMLMMVTEGYDFDAMGVKNSLFISEAYGIGGMLLVFISPFVVGCSYVLGSYLLFEILKKLYGRSVAVVYAIPLYLLSSALTGGFSSFPFLKGILLNLFALLFVWVIYKTMNINLRNAN